MVAVEHAHDHLKQVQAAGWKVPPDHPDIDPPHEALLLREHLTELMRTEEVTSQTTEFVDIMRRSEADAIELEQSLRKGNVAINGADGHIRSHYRRLRELPHEVSRRADSSEGRSLKNWHEQSVCAGAGAGRAGVLPAVRCAGVSRAARAARCAHSTGVAG
jgi:hypothetical protein